MKTRPATLILASVFLLVVIVVAFGSLVIGPRARRVETQNEEARAYIDAMTRLAASNAAISHFRMDLIRAGLKGGSIYVRATLASTNDEAAVTALLRSRRSPYAVGGTINCADSTNSNWVSIAPGDR